MGRRRRKMSVFGRQAMWTFDAVDAGRGRYLRGVARRRRRRPHRRPTSCSVGSRPRTGCAGLPVTTPRAPAFGGFCYLNNAAIATEYLVRASGEPVAILDVDYHDGNGTQQESSTNATTSSTRPCTATPTTPFRLRGGGTPRNEAGAPDAGRTSTSPCPPGPTTTATWLRSSRCSTPSPSFPGSIVVVSLGFDTYTLDPWCDLDLTTAGYHRIAARVRAVGKALVILQEGGYHVPTLGENARAWLRGAGGLPFDPRDVTPLSDEAS